MDLSGYLTWGNGIRKMVIKYNLWQFVQEIVREYLKKIYLDILSYFANISFIFINENRFLNRVSLGLQSNLQLLCH